MADKRNSTDGEPSPLGVGWTDGEIALNFALYSKDATAVTLLLFSESEFVEPLLTVPFNFPENKTGPIWHRRVTAENAGKASFYAYMVDGPNDPKRGLRFDSDKVLIDPYSRGVFFPPRYSRDAARGPGSNAGQAPLGVLPKRDPRLSGIPGPIRHGHDLVIYELHVRGFTRRANSGVPEGMRGTFEGVVAKIPYLQKLGVTAIELMPVHQFEPLPGNYWGYMTLNFFSPHSQYASSEEAAIALNEFKRMVGELHAAKIEVLLDVVYNHTAEMDDRGPMYSFRGIDNRNYYALLPNDPSKYANNSGCGNDLGTALPMVRRLIVDSLRYWGHDLGVDGFRFDLASIFARNNDGTLNLEDPPVISEISSDPALAGVRLIAEPWGGEGGYMMGRLFPGVTWRQWNDHFRDTVRSFIKSDPGLVPDLMTRIYGSSDLLPDTKLDAYRRFQSINYVDCHDGLNLHDLVSFTRDDQRSWNCGYEGNSAPPPDVLSLRRRQMKNLFCILMVSNGTPMFVAGDEFMHTQDGNSNPYNQDNETTWIDWSLAQSNADLFRFVSMMIAFRKAHRSVGRSTGWRADVTWHGTSGPPDLSFVSRSIAFHLRGLAVEDCNIYVMISSYWQALTFRIEEPGRWRRIVDTGNESPDDIVEDQHAVPVQGNTYTVGPRSVAILISVP